MKKMIHGWNKVRKVTTNVQRSWYEVKTDIEQNLYLEEEKKQVMELVKPIEMTVAVAQEEIDEYQKLLKSEPSSTAQ